MTPHGRYGGAEPSEKEEHDQTKPKELSPTPPKFSTLHRAEKPHVPDRDDLADRDDVAGSGEEPALGQWRRLRLSLRRLLNWRRLANLRRIKFRRRWVIAGVAATLVLLWLLPTIVAHSPIFTRILGRWTAEVNGTVTVRSASLGWFSPIVLEGVTVRDREDRELAEIPSVRGDRSLWAILFNASGPGRFRLEKPQLTLVLRDDGSNLEDVLANYLRAKEPKERVDVSVEIVDGSVTVQEARSKRSWQAEKVQFALSIPAKQSRPLELDTSGTVVDKPLSGTFHVTGRIQQDRTVRKAGAKPAAAHEESEEEQEEVGPDELKLALEGVPLAMFETLARRFVPGAKMSGRLSSSLDCRWDSHRPDGAIVFQGKIGGQGLQWSCDALGKDQPSLDRLQASGHAVWQGGQLRLDRVTADSELGSLTVSGVLDLSPPDGTSRLAAMLRQSCEVKGQLDLAKLAARMPNTLRIQKGTQITSGKVQLALSSHRDQNRMIWQGNLETTNLTAQRGGAQLTWPQPVQVTFSAREGSKGRVDVELQCYSDFLTVLAAGTPDQFSASAVFNLNRLAEQSGGFVDLGGLRLEGKGGAKLEWHRTQQQTFDASVSFRADGFRLTVPNRLTWSEDYVVGTLTATGLTDFTSQSRSATAVLDLELGPDVLKVQLVQPDVDSRRGRAWPLEVTGKGQLARWQPRLSPWLDLSRWKLAGSYDVVSKVVVSSEAIALGGARLSLADLVLLSPEANLREKQAQLTLAGQWNWVDKRLDLDSAVLAGSNWKAQADRFVLATPSRGPLELSGSIQGEIGLDRLQQWTTVGQPDPGAWRLGGKLSGRADFQRLGGTVSAAFDATLAEFQAVHPSGQRYQEAKIEASGRASYSDLNRWLQIEKLSVTSSALKSSATGKIAAAGGQTSLQLNGDVQYDLERVSELLRARYGENIRLRGRGQAPVAYKGVLGSDQAEATASLNWESADLFGFQIGQGELLARFSGRTVGFEPMDLVVNGGRLKLGPSVRVNPPPAALGFKPGRVVEQVRITPAMCASLLQYVAPVLAGVAQAQGSFSIDLEGCEMPLANLAASDIAGKLMIHSVQVGPGPLLQELALVLGRATPAEITRDSAIPFRMVGGRVYHRDLELLFGDVKLRTYGSVGMDQTLAMMVVVPTPPSWLANPALAPALKNQKTIEVPVNGTLRQPRIDRVALEQISRQFLQNAVQNAARSAIEDQINRGLNRMLPPTPAPKPKR